jgi:hypothetical protein
MKSKLNFLLRILSEAQSEGKLWLYLDEINKSSKHYKFDEGYLFMSEKMHWISISTSGTRTSGKMENVYIIDPAGLDKLDDLESRSKSHRLAVYTAWIATISLIVMILLFVIGQLLTVQ